VTDSLIGTTLAGFVIEEELGRGGMGVVYRARDHALRRDVALKLLAPHLLHDTAARARFQREILTTVAIEHPHVVPVYTAGYDDEHFFIAMRYIAGRDLWHILQDEGPLAWRRVLRLVGQIASALQTIHGSGLVHRDIKPNNVLIWNPGEPDEHVFLTDFGIAKALHDLQPITRTGAMGTRGYMAPEVLNGRQATAACDQYALAVMAFELLTGQLPFETDDEIRDIPHPLAALAPGVPENVRAAIERALSPDPKQRFPDVRAFARSNSTARDSFEHSAALTATVDSSPSPEQLVMALQDRHSLSVEAIAEIAGLERAEVVRLRRKAARRTLIGD
jgi:serine/threonine-protein kinase